MDVVISLCAICLFFPVFLIVFLLIWVEDRGPILFRQKRLGRNGKEFTIYKFRKFSIVQDDAGPNLTLRDDHRHSKIGKLIDKTKINELPQLFNVLMGDMSLVGPRPEILEYENCFRGKYKDLLNFVPGIFGPSQTQFRNEALMYPEGCDPEDFYTTVLFPRKANIDIQYYNTATISRDLYWMYRSIAAVFGGLLPFITNKNNAYPSDLSDNLKPAQSDEENLVSTKKLGDSR